MNKQERAKGIAGRGAAQRREDERSESDRSAAAPRPASAAPASPPVAATLERPTRRRWSNEQKRAILHEADQCQHGQLGALLRRHGLFSATLKTWRQQLAQGRLEGPGALSTGPRRKDPQRTQMAALEQRNRRLEQQLKEARLIIDIQKKMALLLGEKLSEWALEDSGNCAGNGRQR